MANEGEILLTIFLRHNQSKNLGEINARLEQTGFWKESRRRASRSSRGTS